MNEEAPMVFSVVFALLAPFVMVGLLIMIAAFFANYEAEKFKKSLKETMNLIAQAVQLGCLVGFGVYSLALFIHIFPEEKQVSAIWLFCLTLICLACLFNKKLDFAIIKKKLL